MPTAGALLLDFNGTVSDDERLLASIYAELVAEHGGRLGAEEYFARLVGLTDEEVFRAALGDEVDVQPLVDARVDRYCELTADGSTISAPTRRVVELAAHSVPVVVVSSAFRREVEPALAGSGLAAVVSAIVAIDDVTRPKPDPEPYLRGCERAGVEPKRAVAVEDTPAGVAAAKAAGVRCAALTTSVAPERLAAADVLLPALTPEAVSALLG